MEDPSIQLYEALRAWYKSSNAITRSKATAQQSVLVELLEPLRIVHVGLARERDRLATEQAWRRLLDFYFKRRFDCLLSGVS